MKRIFLLLSLVVIVFSASAQVNFDSYVGTWIFQNNDTVFKIKLQKGMVVFANDNTESPAIFGGYSLSVKGIMKENYIAPQLPFRWDPDVPAPSLHIFIIGDDYDATRLKVKFFDQRMKHVEGEGLWAGRMKLIAPNKLHWTLNEDEGRWWAVEGRSGYQYEKKGFSVPADVIMTKVDDQMIDASGR